MEENIFNQSYVFDTNCRYWNFKNYRIYLSNNKISLDYFNYTNYNGAHFSFCNYRSDHLVFPDYIYSNKFTHLSDLECNSLGIPLGGFNISKEEFEKTFNILYFRLDDSITVSSIAKEEIIAGPCSICGMVDKYNSISNNKSYCYLHCKY
jgi:hypothetical protein